ncbi:MAG: DUF819 family protein [Marinilabiliaceae bacterium]|nr:DUF819 family protein [Marinilabiliaceae bacterium]
MLNSVILTVVYLFAPLLLLYLCSKFQFLSRIGSVVLAYLFGLILGQLGIFGELYSNLQEIIMSIVIPLSIPLMLFSSDVKSWRKLAVKPLYSLLFALLAVFVSVVTGFFIFGGPHLEGFDKIGGLLVGVYSGGTPNLASLKLILGVDEEIYLAVHSYDMAVGAVYLFLLMGVGQRLFQLFLPPFEKSAFQDHEKQEKKVFKQFWTDKKLIKKVLVNVGYAAIIVLIGGSTMLLVPESLKMVVFIFVITGLAIFGSSFKTINQVDGSFDVGMYLILVFSIVVASKVDIGGLSDVNPLIFGYITFVVFCSLLLHILLSKTKNIDADTAIITSAALICSPPFVPLVAGSLKNREVILPGLTIGLIGYALGNYLGYLMAILLAFI